MNFNSQICTSREQSEKLLALGLKKETADCYLFEYEEGKYKVIAESWLDFIADEKYYSQYKNVCFPAWSLHRLIELCSQQIHIGKRQYCHTLHLINNECVAYIDDIGDAYKYHNEGDLYNSLIRCIEWLIKEGYFNKEYLV